MTTVGTRRPEALEAARADAHREECQRAWEARTA